MEILIVFLLIEIRASVHVAGPIGVSVLEFLKLIKVRIIIVGGCVVGLAPSKFIRSLKLHI